MKQYTPTQIFHRSQHRQNAGFTLIEVLIVILIIVTLVGVVVGIAQLAHNKSAEAQCKEMIASWRQALEDYKDDNGKYPDDTDLANAAGLKVVIDDLSNAGITHGLQMRDPWGMEFRYKTINRERYELGSLGMDRKIAIGRDPNQSGNYQYFGQGDDITINNGRL